MLARVRHSRLPRRRGMVVLYLAAVLAKVASDHPYGPIEGIGWHGVMEEVSVLMFRNVECLPSEEVRRTTNVYFYLVILVILPLLSFIPR